MQTTALTNDAVLASGEAKASQIRRKLNGISPKSMPYCLIKLFLKILVSVDAEMDGFADIVAIFLSSIDLFASLIIPITYTRFLAIPAHFYLAL